MRNIAFGYSTRCNIKCRHCVASDKKSKDIKMDLQQAKNVIAEMSLSKVTGISFTAGEPLIYFDDLQQLLYLCKINNIYSRVVTNGYWAKDADSSRNVVKRLKRSGLSQLRLSYSRWHQEHVPQENILWAAKACMKEGIGYFVSFVTDFSEKDDCREKYLRDNKLKFFAEPVIYSGRAHDLQRDKIYTDYQENRCSMNAYLAPDFNMYGCCDAGSHFNTTNFFLLGNLGDNSVDQLLKKSEQNPLYHSIRTQGISNIASFSGMKSRDIITYRKCDLCRKLFNSPETLEQLSGQMHALQQWTR
ncbi:MAG: radical SAM protein [Desulfobulbaceae bacterium]|nr:radical SAM protein [Desulfobulbaceae bacterium]